MTEVTGRIAATVAALPASAGERFGPRIAARHKVGTDWRETSYAQACEAIDELALGLIDAGIEPGDRVCILSDTRFEWTLASYAISAAGAIVVPVYPTNSAKECEWVAGKFGRARDLLRERQPAREDLAGPRRTAGARAHDRNRPGRRRVHARGSPRAGPGT
ncbi:MAG: AMP-binding protein [Solirubrobacteraceae bacterium]